MKPSTIPYSNEKRCTLYVTGILGFDERAVLSSYLCITDTNSTEAAILSGKCGVILLIVVSVDLQSAHNIIMRVCSLQYSGWCRRLFPVISLSLLWFLQFLILPLSLYTSSYNVPLFVYNFMISHWLVPSLALAPDATARKWLGQTKADVMHQLQVITIHLLSPFLYGCSHQTDKWLGWCSKVGLLQSDVYYHTGVLKDVELCAVYVLERAMEWCKESATKEGQPPGNLAELLRLAEEIKDVNRLARALVIARKRKLFLTILERVKESDPRTNCEMEGNQEFLETACLYVVAQSETFQFSLLPLSPSPTVVCDVH
jgi:hypothetical protein